MYVICISLERTVDQISLSFLNLIDFSKEEKDENVKTAFEGIIAATPESVTVKKEGIENRC